MKIDVEKLEVVHHPEKNRFEVWIDGELSKLDYLLSGDTIVMTHVGVYPGHRGQGVAGRITEVALDYARKHSLPRYPHVFLCCRVCSNESGIYGIDQAEETSMTHSEIAFRMATRQDLPCVVRLLAEDDLGSERECYMEPLPASYYSAFEEINNDSNHELIVAELNGEVLGTLHLIFIPSISYQGGLRAQVESVRIDQRYRSQGIGREMMMWTMERARGPRARILFN